ncbi:MAG TPA: TlpA disulfide reductase family protein [Terriglobales bacterium]|jgi:cytochrome c biogenesis protein CcmG/thiol:disulfide interchange protein DsbE|nr:TlpA disulfide reductase family protein [Terriglobales bacterium]
MKAPRFQIQTLRALALLIILAATALLADEPGVRAVLQSASERKAAPEFALEDRSGKTASVKDYRGKVLLLDFWATWCHGCKQEIPWFVEFHRKYGAEGLSVVGVSLDSDGWKVVKPFLNASDVPYRIVLGNDGVAKQYGIASMPDTYLIDRDGKIAAVYSGLVNKDDVEANIQKMLSLH